MPLKHGELESATKTCVIIDPSRRAAVGAIALYLSARRLDVRRECRRVQAQSCSHNQWGNTGGGKGLLQQGEARNGSSGATHATWIPYRTIEAKPGEESHLISWLTLRYFLPSPFPTIKIIHVHYPRLRESGPNVGRAPYQCICQRRSHLISTFHRSSTPQNWLASGSSLRPVEHIWDC